jgi:hypothetical protein
VNKLKKIKISIITEVFKYPFTIFALSPPRKEKGIYPSGVNNDTIALLVPYCINNETMAILVPYCISALLVPY